MQSGKQWKPCNRSGQSDAKNCFIITSASLLNLCWPCLLRMWQVWDKRRPGKSRANVQRVIASQRLCARFVVGRWLCTVKVPQVRVSSVCFWSFPACDSSPGTAGGLRVGYFACLHHHEVLTLRLFWRFSMNWIVQNSPFVTWNRRRFPTLADCTKAVQTAYIAFVLQRAMGSRNVHGLDACIAWTYESYEHQITNLAIQRKVFIEGRNSPIGSNWIQLLFSWHLLVRICFSVLSIHYQVSQSLYNHNVDI